MNNKQGNKNKRNTNKILKKGLILLIVIVLLIRLTIIINNIIGKTNTIILETHADEVSEWKYDIENKSIVKLSDKKRKGDLNGKTKEGLIKEYYTFTGLKKGKTTIKFTFTNKNNGSYGEIKEYNVNVDKRLKLSIQEKK